LVPTLKAVTGSTAAEDVAIAVLLVCAAPVAFEAPLAELQAASMQSNGAATSAFDNPIDFLSGASARTAVALWRAAKPLANLIFRTAERDLTAIFTPRNMGAGH
jgi:hypothetical protein